MNYKAYSKGIWASTLRREGIKPKLEGKVEQNRWKRGGSTNWSNVTGLKLHFLILTDCFSRNVASPSSTPHPHPCFTISFRQSARWYACLALGKVCSKRKKSLLFFDFHKFRLLIEGEGVMPWRKGLGWVKANCLHSGARELSSSLGGKRQVRTERREDSKALWAFHLMPWLTLHI